MNENAVELIGYYGSDTIHAQSAWTSTSRDLNPDKIQRIPNLLKMLASEGHHTPFEKSMLHFLINVDQATHIHLLKHRIGVPINGESARYKELKEDKLYIPSDWNVETQNGTELIGGFKQGTKLKWDSILEKHTTKSNELYHLCLEELAPILGRSRAKESARFFKTMNSQIILDVSFNFRSFMHFVNLRNKPNAQKEVRQVAQQMLELIENIKGNPFKYTLKAFEK
jgi:thymidylate synthase (FAD)